MGLFEASSSEPVQAERTSTPHGTLPVRTGSVRRVRSAQRREGPRVSAVNGPALASLKRRSKRLYRRVSADPPRRPRSRVRAVQLLERPRRNFGSNAHAAGLLILPASEIVREVRIYSEVRAVK